MNDFVGSPPLFGEAPSLPQQIRANFLEPQEQDPQKSRELKTLQAAGVDPSLDVEKAKARFLADTFSNTNWVQRHPTLAAKLADRNYVQIARDDVGNIIETEGLVNEMANAWRVSRDTVFAGKIGTRAMLEVRDLHPYERERLKRAQELASAYMASDPGFIASSVELAGTLVETAGVSAVAGGVTGAVFPPAAPYVAGAAAYAASFQLEGGNLYAELLREFQGSITPAEARDIAIGYGSVIAGADLIGLKVATAPIKGLIKEIAKKRGKGLLTREAASRMTLRIVGQGLGGAVGEATTEGVQDVLQERAKRIASELYRPDNLYEPEYEESFWRAFNHTFKGMVLMAGVPTGVRVINTNIKVANANYDYEQAKKAAEIRGRSKAPEAQREVEAEAGESDTLNSTYYVRAQDFNKAISELAEQTDVTEQQVRDTVEANSPGLMARIDEAAERDGEVELTKSEWGAAFDNTKFRDTALLNTAFEENGLTQREAKEVDLIRDKVVKEEGEAAAKKLQELEAFERELREVRKEMRQQLDVVLKGTDAAQTMNAAANAAVLMGFIRRGALQMNISPREFVEKHLPQIVQQRLEGQQAAPESYASFDQPSDYTFTESDYTPENVAWAKERFGDRVAPNGKPVYQNFVRWFGDSKVVDADGKPLVVYHATTAEFSKFDRQAEGSMFTYGREPGSGGIFFSSTPSSYFTEGSRGQEKGGRTIPAYVTIKNPAIVPRGLSLEEQAKALREAEEQGHDGAIIGEVEYVAFDPNQIKSTQNAGDFSADPGILYSKEGEAPRPNVVRAYHGTAGRFEDFNKAVRDALAKWDVARKELQADIDKARAAHEKNREAEERLREETNQQLESDLAKLEQERKALEDDGSQSFYEKRKEIFRRRDRLKSEAYQTVRNSPQTKALRKTLKSLEEAKEAYQEAKSQKSPPGRYLRRRDIVKTPRTKVDRRTGEKFVVYETKKEGPLVVNEEMLSDFFNERHIGSTDYGYGPRGIYFTEDQGQAKQYAQPAFSGRDRIPGYKPKPYVYTVDIDTSQFYDYRNPVAEIEEAINEKFDSEFKQLLRQRGGPETFEAGVSRAKREVLEAAGYKGMIFRMKDSAGSPGFSKTGEEIVVFDTSVIQEVSSPDGVLFSRTGEGDQKRKTLGTASFEGTDAIQKILLDPDAKPTTLMHELMHWNLELMATIGLDIEGKLAQEGYEATALEKQMLDDIQRLLKWSGFEGTLTEWRAMTTDQRRPFHEAVAVSFETYLYEGVAPSRELRGVFRRLLSYIAGKFEELVKGFQKDYEQEFSRPLPGLTDEVRAIFGRMMSAERDVQAFFDESELDAMMMTKKEWTDSGRDADEYDEYEREFKDALTEATAELTIQRMKEVKTFANAYALVAQKQRGELQRISKEIRQEVQAQVEVESVYQFVSWMRKGTYQSENGTVEPVNLPSAEGTKISRKLNAAIVKAVAPDLYSQLARRGLTSKNGVTLEKVRGMFGFESNRAMLEALATHRNIKEEVLHRTNQRLLNEHTSLMDPIVQQENIHAAVHNKIRQRVVARELKFLLQNGRRSKQELELAKRIAEALIEKTPVGNIDIVAYKRAAARARKKALKALKDGDMEAAAFAKRQELVNEQMIVEGLKARKEVRSLIESNKRAFKHRTDKALASAGYDVTVMKALRAVLARLGIGNVDFDANEALARFVKEDPEFAAEVSGNIASLLGKDIAQPRVGDRRKPMEHLTLGDIRVLRLLSARMMLRAKNKLKTKIGEKRQRVEAAQDEAASTLESNVKDGTKDLDGKKSIFGKIRNYFADLIRFEHLFLRADGGKVGIWTQMFRMVKDAGNRYRQEFKEFAEDFGNRLRALDLTIPGGARELELTVYGNRVVIGENGRNVKSQLIHLAMHYYGNASNRQRLLRGYIGQDIDPELLDEAMEQADLEVKTFLQEQIRQGLLTRKDFEFMQETFKQLSGANMLGRAQQVMMRLRHYEMDTIEGEKFSVQFPDGEAVEFMGGYIPIRYDTSTASVRESDAPGLQDEDMSIEQQATRMLGILPSFTKDRTGPAALPLELNLANIQHHAAEVFKFIHMAEPVTEVYKVVSGRKVKQTFIRKFGTKAYRNMEGWLRRSAYQKFDKSDDTQVGDLMLTMARNANMGIMFLNIGNALQNYAGLIIPMRRVGARRIISALMSNMFSNGPRAEVAEKSVEMRIRLERQIFDIYNQQQRLLTQESGVWDRIQDWSNRYAYFLQQWTQNHVDVAVWQAAYNQETEVALREMIGQPDAADKAEARAVAYADSIVRQTQMAGEKEDVSNFESQGSIYRAMFPFKSWFINWMNNAETQRRLDLDKKGQAKAAALASSYMYLLMLPAMLATAATEIARGEDWDDDDDGYGDDMWELWWRSQAEQITGGLPMISEATRLMSTVWFDDEYWNNRYPATPWQRVVENVIKGPVKKDAVNAAGSVVSQLADLMGIPASRVWKSVNLLGDEFISGELESESTYDLIRGAVTGQRSDLQRLSQ